MIRHFMAACFGTLMVSATLAQAFTPLDRPDPQVLWDRYRSTRWTLDSGSYVLSRICAAGGLPVTPANAEALLARYRQSPEAEERMWLHPLLTQLYRATSDASLRLRIEQSLKDAAATPGIELRARQAAIRTYANLGYLPDAVAVLTQARNIGLPDEDALHAEFARLLPGVPVRTQIDLLRRIRITGHELAVTIALNVLAHESARHLPRDALQEAAALLAAHPTPVVAHGSFGIISASREDDWVRAWVTVHAVLDGQPERFLLARHLRGVLSEPRRLLPLLQSPERGLEVRAALDAASIAQVHAVLTDYARRHPGVTIREAVATARANLGP